ncbi:MAG: CoA transferase, partial [Chloroflexi bacterium]|nr:CoA transferase [Chloroflexota bacterium]
MDTKANISKGPLAGLRIIDSTTMVAMPTGLHIMADMGAEVIKVETHTLFRTEAARLLYADNDPGDEPWNRDGSF